MKKHLLLLFLVMSFPVLSFANDIVGDWKMSVQDGVNYITFEDDGNVILQYASMWGFNNVSTGKYQKSSSKVTLSLTQSFQVVDGKPGPKKDINITLDFSVSFEGNRLILTLKNTNEKTKEFLKDYYDSVAEPFSYKKCN